MHPKRAMSRRRPIEQARPNRCMPGQSMVEFAFCIPIFILLLFGTIEVGMLYKTHAAYDQAAQQAVRIAASAGNAGDADAQMLTSLQNNLAAENLNNITSVTVFDATVAGAPVTTTAQTTYIYSTSLHQFVCQAVPSVQPCPAPSTPGAYTFWDPLQRDTKVGELDHIGLRIAYRYRGVTGVLPPVDTTDGATTLIEPNSYQP